MSDTTPYPPVPEPADGPPPEGIDDGDPRSTNLATAALILGIVALVAALIGIIPFLGWLFGLVGLGAGIAAIIVGIIALVRANQTGTGRAVTGIILAIVAGITSIIVSIVKVALGLAVVGGLVGGATVSPGPAPTASVGPSAAPGQSEAPGESPAPGDGADPGEGLTDPDVPPPAGTESEQAFIGQVREQTDPIFADIAEGATSADALPDEALLELGYAIIIAEDQGALEDVRSTLVQSLEATGWTSDQASTVIDAIIAAADQHLRG